MATVATLSGYQRGILSTTVDSTPVASQSGTLQSALEGLAPFDPFGTGLFGDENTKLFSAMLARAKSARRYYNHTPAGYQSSEFVTMEACYGLGSVIVDKQADWTVGDGIELQPSGDNEQNVELLASLLRAAGGRELFRRFVVNGLLDGNAYWHPYLKRFDKLGRELPPNRWTLGVQRIPYQHLFPIWNTSQKGVMDAALIQFPIYSPADTATAKQGVSLFSRIYTKDKVETYLDEAHRSTMPNPLGFVPFVSGAFNDAETSTNFGNPLLSKFQTELDNLNELAATKRAIVHYHGEPTILVFGASLSSAERSSRRVWSNLDKDAKVEMLETSAGAIDPVRAEVADQYYKILSMGRIPRIALGQEEIHISGVSNQTLMLLFGPLLEATRPHRSELFDKIDTLLTMFLHYLVVFQGLPAELLDDNWDYVPKHVSLLPRDELADFDLAVKKKEAGILSKNEMIRQFARVPDKLRLRQELAADQLSELAMATEKAKALNGDAIDPMAVTLASPFIDVDLSALKVVPKGELDLQR